MREVSAFLKLQFWMPSGSTSGPSKRPSSVHTLGGYTLGEIGLYTMYVRENLEHNSWLKEQMKNSTQVVEYVEINGYKYPRPVGNSRRVHTLQATLASDRLFLLNISTKEGASLGGGQNVCSI